MPDSRCCVKVPKLHGTILHQVHRRRHDHELAQWPPLCPWWLEADGKNILCLFPNRRLRIATVRVGTANTNQI